MTAETNPCRKKWKIAVGILLAVLVLLAAAFSGICPTTTGRRTWPWRSWQAEIIWRFGMI